MQQTRFIFLVWIFYPLLCLNAQKCDLSNTTTIMDNYDFSGIFSDHFEQNPRYESHEADITQSDGMAELATTTTNTGEAWKLYKTQMPYNRSWDFSAEVTIPLYWNSNGGTNGQVGLGLFAGKPVPSGPSCKVYECDMAVINGDVRFIQAQLIANRCGEDPIDVQFQELDQSLETATLKIQFCSDTHTLSLFINNSQVGTGQAIDSSGLDNWGLTDDDVMDIGLIGFSEGSMISSDFLTVDNVVSKIYEPNLSIEDYGKDIGFVAYPNPVLDKLTIEGTLGKLLKDVKVYDLSGKMVFEAKPLEMSKTNINLNHLKKGIYFLTVDNTTIKILKE